MITVYRESRASNMTATGYIKYLWSKGRKQGNNDDIRIQEKTKKNVLYKLLKNRELWSHKFCLLSKRDLKEKRAEKRNVIKRMSCIYCVLVELCRINSGFEVYVGPDNYFAFCYVCRRNFMLNCIGNQEMFYKQK